MEGTSSATLTVYDEAALCSSAFKILRGMVHTWMNEATNYQNFYADLQLQHFYRCTYNNYVVHVHVYCMYTVDTL